MAQVPAGLRHCGVAGTILLLTSRRRLRRWLPATSRLTLKGYPFPFHFRRVATDRYVIADVILSGQYDCLSHLTGVKTIIDVGANIGTASVFFLRAYPEATVIALEPDPGNFELLQRNLNYYGRRAVCVRQALWHRAENLVVDRGHFRDGGEWSFQVKSSGSRPPDVQGVTLPQLLRDHGLDSVDVLKIDIEGAERFVLEDSLSGCLDRVRTLAIELHDADCQAAFARATALVPGRVSRHGEVTVWQHG